MIQPIGFHLRLSSDWLVTALSANIGKFLAADSVDTLGRPVTELLSEDAIHDIRNRMALLRSDQSIEHLLQFALVADGKPFDLSIYRAGEGFAIDAEPSDGHGLGDATGIVEGLLARVATTDDVESLCNETARQLRALTGFDRAVLCGKGKLLGQSARAGPDHPDYAAVMRDIDDLTLFDRDAEPVEVLVDAQDTQARSRSTLRLPSKTELTGLATVGARAALIVPLTRDGQPWGHVGCFHGVPRQIGAVRQGVARLFSRIIALQIEIAELRRGD